MERLQNFSSLPQLVFEILKFECTRGRPVFGFLKLPPKFFLTLELCNYSNINATVFKFSEVIYYNLDFVKLVQKFVNSYYCSCGIASDMTKNFVHIFRKPCLAPYKDPLDLYLGKKFYCTY